MVATSDKSKLTSESGSKIFEDAEMSDSVYTDEEQDIKDAERRYTIKSSELTPQPLNLNDAEENHGKRKSKNKREQGKHQYSKRELKRTSEREPTPYFSLKSGVDYEGKGKKSASFSQGHKVSPLRSDSKSKTGRISSHIRPKPPSSHHSQPRTEARRSRGANVYPKRSTEERHSRRSIHSRTQSRHSNPKSRKHSRSQSTAFPYFDSNASDSLDKSNQSVMATGKADLLSNNQETRFTRDLSGNLTFHGVDEEPTMHGIGGNSNVGLCTSNSQTSPLTRQSHPASLRLSSQLPITPSPPPPSPSPSVGSVIKPISVPMPTILPRSEKRTTVLKIGAGDSAKNAAPLELFPQVSPREMQTKEIDALQSTRPKVEPLATDENEQENEAQGLGVGVGDSSGGGGGGARKTWGSLKSMVGKGSRWVSSGYWDKQDKDEKVFI